MTFLEKYPKLQDTGYLSKMLEDTIYATMALEDQEVAIKKVEEIVQQLLKTNSLEKAELRKSQSS